MASRSVARPVENLLVDWLVIPRWHDEDARGSRFGS